MTIKLPSPQPRQAEFLRASTRYVAFGGARGGGKSFAVRLKAKILALKYAGIRMLLLRRTFPELLGNHIKPFIVETAEYAKFRDSDKTLTFCNGSTLKFGYCDNENDVHQYQGQEYDIIFMDEATHFTESMFDAIKACNRGANDFPKRFYLTCNPGGVGHGWVKRLFVDRDYKKGENADNYTFVRSSIYDNQALLDKDPEYLQTLLALPDDLRKAWLDGDWDMFAGQFFTEFRTDKHVIEPFQIPSWWTRVIALDYGLDMLSVYWGAFDDEGNGYIYKEFNRSDLPVSQAAAEIRAMVSEEELTHGRLLVYAPGDLWGRTKDSGKTIAELFGENGVTFVKADNNRQNGWMTLKEWLQPVGEGENAHPRLRFFSCCGEIIRCLPLLQYAKGNSMDCATEPHDITHAPDALRYLIQSRPKQAKAADNRTDDQKLLSDYKRARISNKRGSVRVYRT